MKPSKATLCAAVLISLIATQCLVVSGQGIYGRYNPARSQVYRFLPLLVGCGVGYFIGKFLACAHCHDCSEENDNTAADCTDEEGCDLVPQAIVANTVCTCDDKVFSVFK